MLFNRIIFRAFSGWLPAAVLFTGLYLTGLHTEAIGQVQRMLLATGFKQAAVPTEAEGRNKSAAEAEAFAGPDFQMTTLDGKTVSFSSLKGKVIFLNLWATWCPPCVAEMPNIQSLYEKVGSKDIVFVMLSLDKNGTEKVRKFISNKGYTFPVYLPATGLPDEFQSRVIPTTFIIDRQGKIATRQEGMAEYDTPQMQQYLKDLAKK